jgi:hypothetical protein
LKVALLSRGTNQEWWNFADDCDCDDINQRLVNTFCWLVRNDLNSRAPCVLSSDIIADL